MRTITNEVNTFLLNLKYDYHPVTADEIEDNLGECINLLDELEREFKNPDLSAKVQKLKKDLDFLKPIIEDVPDDIRELRNQALDLLLAYQKLF